MDPVKLNDKDDESMKFQHAKKSIAPSINNETLYYLNKMSYQLNQIILIHGESLM